MKFQRKTFADAQTIVLSDVPLFATQLEARLAAVLPSIEERLDSFEDYNSAYEFCSDQRNIGLIVFHAHGSSKLPSNAVDELSAPFEGMGATAGLFVIAETNEDFARTYKTFGQLKRLLNIVNRGEVESDSQLKRVFSDAWAKFELLVKGSVLPADQLELLRNISNRFEDIGRLERVSRVLTHRLERGWLDDLLVDAAPCLLAIPDSHSWLVQNSSPLLGLRNELIPFLTKTPEELITSGDSEFLKRALALAYQLYQLSKTGESTRTIERLCTGSSAFAPTLKKVLSKEKDAMLEILSGAARKVA